MVGAENAYADLDVESVRVSLDQVLERQPDVRFVGKLVPHAAGIATRRARAQGGLALEQRFSSYDLAPFTDESTYVVHVLRPVGA